MTLDKPIPLFFLSLSMASLLSLSPACDGDDAEPEVDAPAQQAADARDPDQPEDRAEQRAGHARRLELKDHQHRAALNERHLGPVAPDARESFEEMVELLEAHYVDGALSEDELWTGAIEGVMNRLIQHEHKSINSLLSPDELRELMSGTAGSVVGVGVMIEQVADVLLVKGVIPGGPAADSGLQAGDRILAVDGERLAGKPLVESVHLIRGEAGTDVELFVQRDTEEWTVTIERGVVKVSSVESIMLGDEVGYLRVNSFAKHTTEDVDAHLESLGEAGMRSLILDLRHNPGGLLETALTTADRFLPAGQRIVTVRGRKGEEHTDASETHPWESLPMVVLVGPKTASGAEILAAALDENDRAAVVGEPTFGKGTVEAIHELGNGWALKLSTARFFSPDGEPRQGNGVMPDFVVSGSDGAATVELDAIDVDADPQLRAAIELLSR